MSKDRIDRVLMDWSEERPDLSTEALGIVLRIQTLAKSLADQLTDQLAELGLEWWEYDVLSVLRRQGKPFSMSSTEIAESIMLSTGALTNRVDGLQEKGLVSRSEDPDDRRRVIVTLTPKGEKLVNEATETRFQSAADALSDIPEKQQVRLNSLLRKLSLQIES